VSLLACSGVFPRSFLVASNHVSYVQLCINNLFLLLYHWLSNYHFISSTSGHRSRTTSHLSSVRRFQVLEDVV
jgi:hypothetical protein